MESLELIKSFIYITAPSTFSIDITNQWFDTGRQKMLILKQFGFYWWDPFSRVREEVIPVYGPVSSLPSTLIEAKVSLDSELIALQISKQKVLVLQIKSNQKWTIDIRHPEENQIISPGIIWSEHGGNSQDLVILTSRGLELYKVSAIRGQCKLSRNMNHVKATNYWYDPHHRVIMLTPPIRQKDRVLEVHAYYLRFDALTGFSHSKLFSLLNVKNDHCIATMSRYAEIRAPGSRANAKVRASRMHTF